MKLICLDLEGVLVPEIWLNLARETGITALERTTRDEPDYSKLMYGRLEILEKHDLGISDIQQVISKMQPLEGAREFLARLREAVQVVILSDTFIQFADPLMRQLERPTLLCNELILSPEGRITDFRLRQEDGKRNAVKAFQSMGLEVSAAGDSYNDLGMIRQADRGAFFRPPESITREEPDLPVFEDYDDFLRFLID